MRSSVIWFFVLMLALTGARHQLFATHHHRARHAPHLMLARAQGKPRFDGPVAALQHRVPKAFRHPPRAIRRATGRTRLYTAARSPHPVVTQTDTLSMDSLAYVRDVNFYHRSNYDGETYDMRYVDHPLWWPGAHWVYYGKHPWYDGYWHHYWRRESWRWWGGNYGFWLNYGGVTVFVYEYWPGDCWYWNGHEWAPWYDPPAISHWCPY